MCFLLLLAGIAQADENVPSNAEVSSVGVAPNIECKWELPDMQSDVGGIQYGTALDPHQHDDDMGMVPDANNDPSDGIQVPCSGPPATVPSMPQDVQHMTQVRPNPEDLPEERRIELWMAVDHPNGISNIADTYWKVYHPDGSEKVQVHGAKVNKADCDPLTGALGDSATVGKMFEAAVHTGQMTAEAVDDTNKGILTKCLQEEKAVYQAEFNLSKHQPCGMYKIEATAVAVGGQTTKLINYLDVQCVYFMQIDFDAVDWGTITPGLKDIVSGDLIWDDPHANAPTVKNVGNDGMGLSLHFTEMSGVSEGKIIDQFDACFGKSPSTLECIDPIPASSVASFSTNPDQVLCSNEMGKLDLSLHPPAILPADIYTGNIDVMAFAAPGVCY
jgi:hypothetical protein